MIHITWGIIVASGKDQQLNSDVGLAFLNLESQPLISYSLLAYEQCPDIDGIIVVAQKDRLQSVQSMAQMYGCSKLRRIVAGTTQRRSSLLNGLKALDDDVTIVSVHDASRPCVSVNLISETVKAAKRYGTGIAAARLTEPVKEVDKGQKVSATLDSSKLWSVHSPQTYRLELLQEAMDVGAKKNLPSDDESAAIELLKKEVHLVPSTPENIKIESPEDLTRAAALLRH